MTDAAIIPCPFCGAPGQLEHFAMPILTNKGNIAYYIECSQRECGSGPIRDTEEEAVRAWNERHAN